MSLRADVHEAFDEIAPPTAGMPERVVESVLRDRRRLGRSLRPQVPLSLVATLVLTTMVIGALVGGRLVQDWNAFYHAGPAGSVKLSPLAQLESRPLDQWVLNAGDPCPLSPINEYGLYSTGPAHLALGAAFSTAWGNYWYLAVVTDANLTGLVLMRGRDLRTDQPVVFVGRFATGSRSGGDIFDGKAVEQRAELVVDTSHPLRNYVGAGTWTWPITAGLANGGSGCIEWQIEGADFSETVVTHQAPA